MPDVTLAVNGAAGSDLVCKMPNKVQVASAATVTDPSLFAEAASKQQEQPTMPDIANTMERKQPDGEDVKPAGAKQQIAVVPEETDEEALTSNGMLDRISHDLDYLLNRTKEDA